MRENILVKMQFSPYITGAEQPNHNDSSKKTEADIIQTAEADPPSIDVLIKSVLDECDKLPSGYFPYVRQIRQLYNRLAGGRLNLAVLGEFNRGKSTFINGLIGIKLLPTSMVPVTTVPTRIIYGSELSCTIRFFTDKGALLIRSSPESISDALLKHVSEENNPGNHLCVSSVDVSVPSPLLKNGTVLIDTPGFGSTYLHNTKTALDILKECDAALFLLSADLAVTQTELEFLKQAISNVPKLFFILNKIDLLTPQQLEKVDRFAGDILKNGLKLDERPRLFHICARRAENAVNQTLSDPQWTASGMETIKEDIISFMVRDKYFTLSQAVNDKLREAVKGIIGLLQKEIDDVSASLALVNEEKESIVRRRIHVDHTLEKELALVQAEKKAVMKFLDEQLPDEKPKIFRKLHEAMKLLLDPTGCDHSACRNVTSALNAIIPEVFNRLRAQIVARLNRPIKKALFLHIREFNACIDSLALSIGGINDSIKKRLQEKLDLLEINPDEPIEDLFKGLTGFSVELQWVDRFFPRQKRLIRLHQRYDNRMDEFIRNLFFGFSKELRLSLEKVFSSMEEIISSEYKHLSDEIENIIKRKEELLAEKDASEDRTGRIQKQIEFFKRIASQLR